MKCPYCADRLSVQQMEFEYDEAGQETAQSMVDIQRTVLHDCLREECGAWHDGRCAYVGAVS